MQGSFLKRMHARVYLVTVACSQKGHFDACTPQTFGQRMCTRYAVNPGCAQSTSWMHATPLISVCSYPTRFEVSVLFSPLLLGSALLTSNGHYFVSDEWIHLSRLPNLQHLIEKRFYCLFSEKESSRCSFLKFINSNLC